MDALSVIWFAAAGGGAVAGLAGLVFRRWRPQLFGVAAGCFTISGILGIFSIGIFFLVLAVLCVVGAGATQRD